MADEQLNQDGLWQAKDLAVLRQVVQDDSQLLAHFSESDRALLDVNHDGQVDEKDIEALCLKLLAAEVKHHPENADKLSNLRNKLR